jgi:cysteinyl-tRNA synthetase
MREKGLAWQDVIRPFWEEYLEAMDALNVTSVNLYARATDYIPEIVEQVRVLIELGYAYAVDGDVYYAVGSFDGWGRLSGQRTEELKPGARVEVDAKKRSPADFALWKAQQPGEPAWDSPWGKGRPGWHIEDTAITIHHFGPQYDIHGGATELMFPHHEAEIAQAESFTGKRPFVKHWMHTGLLNVKGEKMSKSLRNFWSLKDGLAQYDGEVLRFFLVYAHYRSPIDFSPEALDEAKAAYGRLTETIGNLGAELRSAPESGFQDPVVRAAARAARETFEAAMDDDFNTREAVFALIEFTEALRDLDSMSRDEGREVLQVYGDASRILGVFEGALAGAA